MPLKITILISLKRSETITIRPSVFLSLRLNQVRAGCEAGIPSRSRLVVLAIPVRQEPVEAGPELAKRARHPQKS